ncbi:MAG: glycosyltransferase family 4 protein [Planctomycetota bacterium]
MAWFLDDVWPRVRASRPDATLDLVGSRPDASRAAAWSAVPRVRFVGRVDDVAACYAGAISRSCPPTAVEARRSERPKAYLHGRACVVTSAGARAAPAPAGGQRHGRGRRRRRVCRGRLGLLGDPGGARRMAAAGPWALISGLSFERFAATTAEVAARALERT